jgi:hypothetical protein
VIGKLLALDRRLESTLPALLALLGVPVPDLQWQLLDRLQRRERTLDAVRQLLLQEGPFGWGARNTERRRGSRIDAEGGGCYLHNPPHWLDAPPQAGSNRRWLYGGAEDVRGSFPTKSTDSPRRSR